MDEEFEYELKEKLRGVNITKAVHRARIRSTRLLEEQGISTLALMLSKTLVDAIEHPQKIRLEY